jgi:hypothetical protein
MMECPHCETPSPIRTSKTVTLTFREIYYQCPNFECGHTWKASLAFIHTISPSARPRPGLDLAMAQLPPPANDRHPATLPVTPRDNANDDASQEKRVAPAIMSPNRFSG